MSDPLVTARFAVRMARYNQWQNQSLVAAASDLTEAARTADRGAFFGSITGTFNHLLWGDRIWMNRFAGTLTPGSGSIAESVSETPDWQSFRTCRQETDAEILSWTEELTEDAMTGALTWFSGAAGREVSKPLDLLIMHFFNHQTHHRGQIHAMLTAAGARPDDTDLFLMPD